MMDAETSMNSEECKTLGFVSVILPRQQLKAVARIAPINTMKEKETNFWDSVN